MDKALTQRTPYQLAQADASTVLKDDEVVENQDAVIDDIAESILPEDDAPALPEGAAPPADAGAVDQGASPPSPASAPPAPAPASPAEGALVAPDTLTGQLKTMWPTLPPVVQQEFIKRENDFRKGMDEIRDPAAIGQGMSKMIEPYAAVMQEYGVNPFEHIGNLMQHHAILMFGRPQQKLDILMGLARDCGIDPRQFGGYVAQRGAADPQVHALRQENAQIRAAVSSLMGKQTQEQEGKLESAIWNFANDEKTHPDFWTVAPMMVQIFQKEPGLTLDEAYEKAYWLTPVTRQKGIERETAAKIKAEAERARTSRRTTSARVRSSSDARPATPVGDDITATLTETLASIHSR